MKLESSKGHLVSKNNNKKNADKTAAKMAVYYKNYKKTFPETGKLQGFVCELLILLILELQTSFL